MKEIIYEIMAKYGLSYLEMKELSEEINKEMKEFKEDMIESYLTGYVEEQDIKEFLAN
ncbi:MAG: hypothetical protein ACXACY_20815 [Candidatus Hodarchaeales archaeon]|jgi:hypothetical protein